MKLDDFEIGGLYVCKNKVFPTFSAFIFLGKDPLKVINKTLNVEIYFIEENEICWVAEQSHYLVHAVKL